MKIKLFLFLLLSYVSVAQENVPDSYNGKKLVWHDEFNKQGKPDPENWSHENGFKRNNELQWYQEDNAKMDKGVLNITAKRVKKVNPTYRKSSNDWKTSRPEINFTSSSIHSKGKREFQYGTFLIRAKLDSTLGSWPAIWTLGIKKPWPSNGEIDIMELYRVNNQATILGNIAWGTNQAYRAKWDERKIPLTHFLEQDPDWINKFHIWRMDWTENHIKIFLDDELINEVKLSETLNPDGFNPFKQPHYLLLNLAIGGNNGGAPRQETKTIKYEVDYVRVYQ
ncbi:glycoside hydrolase family 16 protein [uncultured Arcticibacterium sp.]|uniref:glycoside hydrolase family 16 protein n=1 Tax=uncultured Arcticibacterium sp. TaxID=2173042 RepID=UPI0030F78137